MKLLVVFLFLLALPAASPAEERPSLAAPRWSLEVKGGTFLPALDNLEFYFGRKDMLELGASLAHAITDYLEAGIGVGRIEGRGHAYAPVHQALVADVDYRLYPVKVFVLARGVFSDRQWLVPYAGGGWTRMYYREIVEAEKSVRGVANGYHLRGGVRLPLNALDPRASRLMYSSYGVLRTSLFFEAEKTEAVIRSLSLDLGGMSYMGGLLFEF